MVRVEEFYDLSWRPKASAEIELVLEVNQYKDPFLGVMRLTVLMLYVKIPPRDPSIPQLSA